MIDNEGNLERVVHSRGCLPEERKGGKGLINHSVVTPHVVHETLQVLTVQLWCHPHVNASQRDSVESKLLLLQSTTDGFFWGTQEGRAETETEETAPFYQTAKLQNNKGNMEATTADTTTSSADAAGLIHLCPAQEINV